MITLSKVLITSSKDFQRSEIKLPMASDLMSGGELLKLRLLDTQLTGFEQLSKKVTTGRQCPPVVTSF
jgi:hypothetical protein